MTDGTAVTQALILLIPVSATVIALYVWCALALSAVFAKSGEPRWKAWVPFVNLAALLVLGGIPGWWVLLLLIPGFGGVAVWILVIVAAHRVGLSFGYGGGMTVLAALLFPVWATVIGFGSARWIGREGRRRRGTVPDAAVFTTSDPAGRAPSEPPPPPAPPAVSPFAPPPLEAPAPGADTGSRSRASGSRAEDGWDILSAFTEAEQSPPAPMAPIAPPASPSISGWGETDQPDEPASPPETPAAPEPFAPPARAARPVETGATGLAPSAEPIDDVTDAVPGAPAPVSAVSGRSSYDDAPLFPPVADGEHWATGPDAEPFPETSGAVSAIVGSPVAGSPRMARSAVSASADDEGDFDATLLAHRNRPRWSLVTAAGDEFELRAQVVILGRRPSPDPAHSGAQLVALDDVTVSKTHARLELRGDQWHVVDLGSTNGVVVVSVTGSEIELAPGGEAPAGERLLLGDLELRLVRASR
ncbi:MAG: hypothetical protein BGO47_07345 [Microbacterium sp. 67-17]|uniref:DUF5684 domain-containing protein n=1 Tax=Microbacterium sp. 67-17 TaxID=1895782 RepID=UPI00096517AC|nr:DUF5684 domain-containing protein [Microbacterium sp. 67-17]OJV98114.1 MAG: hypothetical protein BGO47_07345 [Microbacterium sp. 67-17]